eukprot:112783-Prorocentrum_minimum.AAC.1
MRFAPRGSTGLYLVCLGWLNAPRGVSVAAAAVGAAAETQLGPGLRPGLGRHHGREYDAHAHPGGAARGPPPRAP